MAFTDSGGILRVQLLGPVEARVDGEAVALGGPVPRALLAILAVMGGRVVSTERLIDELWGEAPPTRARDSLQVYVSRLRKALTTGGSEGGRLVSQPGGYQLRVLPDERDLDRWDGALGRARRARAAGRLEAARAEIEEALRLWRGEPFGGVGNNGLLVAERARLEEEQLSAIIESVELDLELGDHMEVPGRLEAIVMAHPFNERLVELLMLALYRSGRQADALAAFQAARERLVDQLGIEPGERLRGVHDDVLKHSPQLAAPVDRARRAQWLQAAAGALTDRALPVPPNRTIGREQDLDAIAVRLCSGSVRLLTLTGPGGVGKTRLALEAARAVEAHFGDGACFVSLAALQRPEDVPSTIVKSLGIVALSGESTDQATYRFLATRHLLLVVDNFEHLLGAAPFVGELLARCPAVTVLGTSREPLSLQGEARHPVSPLALPDPARPTDPGTLAGVGAVALFTERAGAHDPGFELETGNAGAVAEICRRLHGLPLAIELAAARCSLLSPGEIADRLDIALEGLGAGDRDAPARHQTLRATIDWSHELLSDDEKECFARFAVFAGGATVEATEMITGADLDTLEHLVAKSLLVRRQNPRGPTRLLMLETVRAYASERFTTDARAIREHHFSYYLALAQRHGSDRALRGADRPENLVRLDDEIDNLNAVLGWAVGEDRAEAALELCAALGGYWRTRDRYADAVYWIDQALNLTGADAHAALRVHVLCAKAWSLWPLGLGAEQHAAAAEAERTARALGDLTILSYALQTRARIVANWGEPETAETLAIEALQCATDASDGWEAAMAAFALAVMTADPVALRARVEQAAGLLEAAGNVYHLADLLACAAYTALCNGSDRDASEFATRATPLVRRLEHPYLWTLLSGNGALAALMTGDTEAARRGFCEELALCRELMVLPFACEGLGGLAAVATIDGELHRAALLFGAAAAHRYGRPEDALDARLHERFFEPARRRRGPDP